MHFLYCCSVGLLLWYWPGCPSGASASRISSFIRARRSLEERTDRPCLLKKNRWSKQLESFETLNSWGLRRVKRTHRVTMSALAAWTAMLRGSWPCSSTSVCDAPLFRNKHTWLNISRHGDQIHAVVSNAVSTHMRIQQPPATQLLPPHKTGLPKPQDWTRNLWSSVKWAISAQFEARAVILFLTQCVPDQWRDAGGLCLSCPSGSRRLRSVAGTHRLLKSPDRNTESSF